jgi:hypothetical protein
MKIIITFRELSEKNKWMEFCRHFGVCPWGNRDDSEEFCMTFEDAKELCLLNEEMINRN